MNTCRNCTHYLLPFESGKVGYCDFKEKHLVELTPCSDLKVKVS